LTKEFAILFLIAGDCTNCVDEGVGLSGNRWTMPLLKLGEKRYYLGIFFKVRNKRLFLHFNFSTLWRDNVHSVTEQVNATWRTRL